MEENNDQSTNGNSVPASPTPAPAAPDPIAPNQKPMSKYKRLLIVVGIFVLALVATGVIITSARKEATIIDQPRVKTNSRFEYVSAETVSMVEKAIDESTEYQNTGRRRE